MLTIFLFLVIYRLNTTKTQVLMIQFAKKLNQLYSSYALPSHTGFYVMGRKAEIQLLKDTCYTWFQISSKFVNTQSIKNPRGIFWQLAQRWEKWSQSWKVHLGGQAEIGTKCKRQMFFFGLHVAGVLNANHTMVVYHCKFEEIIGLFYIIYPTNQCPKMWLNSLQIRERPLYYYMQMRYAIIILFLCNKRSMLFE